MGKKQERGMGSTGEGGNSQIPDAGGGEKRELGAGTTGRGGEGEWGMGRLGEGEVWKELKRRGWGAPRRG